MHHQHEQEWHTDASSWNHAVTSKWIKGCMQSKQKARFIYHTARNVSVSGSLSQKARQCVSFRVTCYTETIPVSAIAPFLPVCRRYVPNPAFHFALVPSGWTNVGTTAERQKSGIQSLSLLVPLTGRDSSGHMKETAASRRQIG